MKKWIAGAVVAAGLVAFGGTAIVQDAARQGAGSTQGVQQEDRPGGHEGCRDGQEASGGAAT